MHTLSIARLGRSYWGPIIAIMIHLSELVSKYGTQAFRSMYMALLMNGNPKVGLGGVQDRPAQSQLGFTSLSHTWSMKPLHGEPFKPSFVP